jgi:phosphoribosylformylglycinamidine synthase
MPTREATWEIRRPSAVAHMSEAPPTVDAGETLLRLLANPTIASKRWIVRQYDHEVQGNTAVKPLVGPIGEGPGDASVIEPVPGIGRGLAIANGMAPRFADPHQGGDAYWSALAALDECVRNLVCVGADPARIAILDNFCWPACAKPENLGTLTRAAVGCYDGAKAYRTPFVSGKDSLNNQFTTQDGRTIEIPPTLLISGIGVVESLDRCVTSDAKQDGSALILVGGSGMHLGGAHVLDTIDLTPAQVESLGARMACPTTDLDIGPASAAAVASAIRNALVLSAHDCSEGGLLVALAEMLIGAMESPDRASLGAAIDLTDQPWMTGAARFDLAALFAENTSRYILEVPGDRLADAQQILEHVPHAVIGRLESTGRLRVTDAGVDLDVVECARAWLGTLDW